MREKIEIFEVGPRDGFQSVKVDCILIPTEEKLKVIDNIIAAGIKHIEFSSFVSPKAIPQLADSVEVTKYVLEKYPNIDLFALVPNLRGARTAYELGLGKVCYVVSLSASHNKANINRTHEQSLDAYKEIRENYPDLEIIVDLATSFGCPFEGKYNDTQKIISFLGDYVKAGMKVCCLCDTIGIADPMQVKNVISSIKVQSTLGGLGGCPFAPGASGNLSTEDLVWMLNEMGYDTGVSFFKILKAAKEQAAMIPGQYSGHQININANFIGLNLDK